MPLTDTGIRRVKPESKPLKLFDERGLFLLVNPNGGKWWRFKHRFEGKEKLLALGGNHAKETRITSCRPERQWRLGPQERRCDPQQRPLRQEAGFR